jgi:hypothetical protein
MTFEQIIGEIELLLHELSAPVNDAEVADGWRPESKQAVKDYFYSLKGALENNLALPALNVARSLDAWGVGGGDLAESASRISNAVRALS